LNAQEKLFGKMTVLEHPRFIQQYKSKEKQLYIDKYLQAFSKSEDKRNLNIKFQAVDAKI